MKEFRGTKGKWKIKEDFRQPSILNDSGQVIFYHNKSCYDNIDLNHVYYSHNKMIRNAKLVANAPQLLDLLKEVKDELFQATEALCGLGSAYVSPVILKCDNLINEILD